MKGLITEEIATKKGFVFTDANAAKESDRISLAGASKIRFLVRVEAGAATTCAFKLIEHDAAAAGASQDLISVLPHYYRVDGSAGVKVEPVLTASVTVVALDTAAGLVMVEVDHSDMTDGFTHVSLELAAPGALLRISGAVVEIDHERKPAYELA